MTVQLFGRHLVDLMHKAGTFFLNKFFAVTSRRGIWIVCHCRKTCRCRVVDIKYGRGSEQQIKSVKQDGGNCKTSGKVFHGKLFFCKKRILS